LLAFTEKVKKEATHLTNVVLVAGCLHVQLAQFFGGLRTFLGIRRCQAKISKRVLKCQLEPLSGKNGKNISCE
jgi:hypothetical protein